MNSREEILSKIKAIRQAKNQTVSISKAPVASGLKNPEKDLDKAFHKSLLAVNGECFFSDNLDACTKDIKAFLTENNISSGVYTSATLPFSSSDYEIFNQNTDLSKINAGITSCDFLAAQTGTVLLSAKESRGLLGISPIHIVVAKQSQLRASLDQAVNEMSSKYKEMMPSQLTLITGPSRTADIEKTLILGAHGPKRLVVFIYED